MDSPASVTLEELPDSETLEKEAQAIQDKLAEGGSRIARVHWGLTQKTVLNGLKDCLGKIDPIEWIGKGWGTAIEVQELARQTAGKPDAEKELPLAKHKFPVVLHPIVTIHCDPIMLPPLTFTLTFEAKVDSAVLIIRGGRLAAIEAAKMSASATLSYDKRELKKIELDPVPLCRPYEFANGGLVIATSP
ncbi:hypothetical protein [Sphingomonas sp. URHD0057]|uniref:hypothetical protein n=1 Tax=Sphingomonas sp. URHD0057 TaxID=1380389 RepID=UPI00048D345A|nr:hypothetical protein [Sphingomonas sp. URHD0057]